MPGVNRGVGCGALLARIYWEACFLDW